MNCLAFSDTHGFHNMFSSSNFDGIDAVFFAGDCSNNFNKHINSNEVINFLEWFNDLPVKYKIFVAGNHDTSIFHKIINPRNFKNIIYLEDELIEIDGIKIYGSPYSPTFGKWVFMKDRGKIDLVWKNIPENIDILITHSPPKGILDLSINRDSELEFCGCKSLLNHVKRVKPKFHIFGHIHNYEGCINSGLCTLNGIDTTFINASCVNDREFDKGLTSFGTKFKI